MTSYRTAQTIPDKRPKDVSEEEWRKILVESVRDLRSADTEPDIEVQKSLKIQELEEELERKERQVAKLQARNHELAKLQQERKKRFFIF